MIFLKIFLVFLSCFLFRGIWSRLIDFFVREKVRETPLSIAFAVSILQQVLQPSMDRALLMPWIQMRARENSKRIWLLKLGLSSLSGFFLLGTLWSWTYFLGLRGSFIDLNFIQRMGEPPAWSLWMGDQSVTTFLALGLFGVFCALAFRRPFFGASVVAVLLFSGILSVAGGVCILLGERWGLKLLFRWKYTSEMLHHEMNWSLLWGSLVLLASAFWGRALVGVMAGFGFQNTFHPADRFVLLTVTLMLWCLIEALVSMAFYHFYWLKYQSNDIR